MIFRAISQHLTKHGIKSEFAWGAGIRDNTFLRITMPHTDIMYSHTTISCNSIKQQIILTIFFANFNKFNKTWDLANPTNKIIKTWDFADPRLFQELTSTIRHNDANTQSNKPILK